MTTVVVALPSSLALVMDPSVGQVPSTMAGALVAATPTCVALGTLSALDGTTRLSLGPGDGEPALCLIFDGVLDTPGGTVVVSSVLSEVLLQDRAPSPRTRVRIFANDDEEPSEIDIRITPERTA